MTLASPPRRVFGPVTSRRLGRSLGIDPMPLKTCNFDCVYCQLGRTHPKVRTRARWSDPATTLEQVRRRLRCLGGDEFDWVTIASSGEPTLHADLGALLRGIRRATTRPIAVLTNGALLARPEVREELRHADAVLPTLTAGSSRLFQRIHRPHPSCTFAGHVAGLQAFARERRSALWIEVMLIDGVNDTPEALTDLAAVLRRIRPDAIHLDTPERPPAEPWVRPARAEALVRAQLAFGGIARVVRAPALRLPALSGPDPLAALVSIITRHPLPDGELDAQLDRLDRDVADGIRRGLRRSRSVHCIERHGTHYWVASEADFP